MRLDLPELLGHVAAHPVPMLLPQLRDLGLEGGATLSQLAPHGRVVAIEFGVIRCSRLIKLGVHPLSASARAAATTRSAPAAPSTVPPGPAWMR